MWGPLKNAKTDYDAHCTVGVVIAFAFFKGLFALPGVGPASEDTRLARGNIFVIFEVLCENLRDRTSSPETLALLQVFDKVCV